MPADRSVLVRLRADISQYQRQMALAGKSTAAFVKDLDSADSRMANLVQTAIALAPALVPIGGAGVTALAGLTTQLGFAAAGAGVTALAFNGVGDALKALNDYQLDPTEAKFKKLEQTMSKLGPAAGEFVLFLDSIEPKLKSLQRAASEGLLPGATEGMQELLELTPEVRGIITALATTTGDLLADAGDNLNDPRWQDFFRFLQNEARPTLENLGMATGNAVEGLVNMWMALDPLSDQFSGGLLDEMRDFAKWSRELDGNEDFQGFLDYVHRVGPEAADTLGSLVHMLGSFVAAAAPVGEASLPIIRALADILSTIADSPAGPVLIGAAAGISAISRAIALFNAANGTAVTSLLGFGSKDEKGIGKLNQRATALKSTASAIALLGVSMTDLDDEMGLANTATLALVGSFFGPWGAAIGGAVGFAKDLSAANDELEGKMRAVGRAADSQTIDFAGQRTMLADLRKEQEEYGKAVVKSAGLGGGMMSVGDALAGLSDIFTNTREESREFTDSQISDFEHIQAAAIQLHDQLSVKDFSLTGIDAVDDANLQNFIDNLAPKAIAAGIDLQQVLAGKSPLLGPIGEIAWDAAIAGIRGVIKAQDSIPGRSKAVADAIAGMGDELEETASDADVLQTALDALFGPGLDQSAAQDAWVRSLQDLRESLKATKGEILGNSEAALDYRDKLRDSISATLDKVVADARATDSGEQAARTLIKERDALIDMAVAAGASEDDIRSLLRQMNLTPEALVTVVTTPGVLSAQEQIKALGVLYHLTPNQVRTLISQLGMATSKADIDALAKKYHLTPKEVRTLIKANAAGAFATIQQLQNALAGLHDKTINVFTVQHTRGTRLPEGEGDAEGGHIRGPGGPRDDLVPRWLSNGEYVVKTKAVEKYGIGFFDDANAMRLGNGGRVSGGVELRPMAYAGDSRMSAEVGRLAQTVDDLRRQMSSLGAEVRAGSREGTAQGAHAGTRAGMDANNRGGYMQRGF